MTTLDWIAVDWGQSRLRVWGLAGQTVTHTAQSEDGMAHLARSDLEPALLALIEDWLPKGQVTSVIACGMLGGPKDRIDTGYGTCPCAPLGSALVPFETRDLRLSVHVVPGLKQTTPPDVMRGEETQIAGFLALNPGWDGVICLPGTHSKWAHISAGEVVSFQTFLTGEMFAFLSQYASLRHSVSGWDEAGFEHGFDESLERPERLMARLFSIRAETLLLAQDAAFARARLSGLLIGAEMAASKPYWLGQRVAIIGATDLAQCYTTACARLSVPTTLYDAEEMTLAGLDAARACLLPSRPAQAH
jgi:2-dehydro-3-deoxygalactonokinase